MRIGDNLSIASLAPFVVAFACGCGSPPAKVPTPAKIVPVAHASSAPRSKRPKLPEWTYWEAADVPFEARGEAPTLPLKDGQFVRKGGMDAKWKRAGEPFRDAIRKNGFVVSPESNGHTLSGFYARVQAENLPSMITLDSLFYLTHLGLAAAMSEAENRAIAPALEKLLTKMDARLVVDSKDAKADLSPAYRIARGIVAVALSFVKSDYVPPADIADVVSKERENILLHRSISESPLLGIPLEYSTFAPRATSQRDDRSFGFYRALTWLGHAPLLLMGRGEVSGGGLVSVAGARTHSRAALMLSRLVDRDVDADAAHTWEFIDRILRFALGPTDDVTPLELGEVAEAVGADLRDLQWIANVARVDKIRRAAKAKHTSHIFDGSGGASVSSVTKTVEPTLSLRFLGARAVSDAEVLQGLVFPAVGAVKGDYTPVTMRDGKRALPTALDVFAWLGSGEARALVHEGRDDAYEGYDATFDRLSERRPADDSVARHNTLYASGFDAMATYLYASAADETEPYAASATFRRRKIETALASWSMLRHDATSFGSSSPLEGASRSSANSASDVPWIVEAHPEAIAKLLAFTRQTRRGLTALGAMNASSAAHRTIEGIEEILEASMIAAARQASGSPVDDRAAKVLASFTDRVAAIEEQFGSHGTAEVPVVIDVHADLGGGRVLEEATGYLCRGYFVARAPNGEFLLTVGATIPHYEFAQPSSIRLSDVTWRARLDAGSAPTRSPYAAAYLVAENARR